MNKRTVLILAAAIAGLVLLMLVLRQDNDATVFGGGTLLPDFESVANQVTNISVMAAAGSLPSVIITRRSSARFGSSSSHWRTRALSKKKQPIRTITLG